MAYKQAIVLRENLGMSRGKMIAQACHASLNSYKKASPEEQAAWEDEGSRKVVLDAGDRELVDIHQSAKEKGLASCLVKDAGMTELEPGTKTAVGIGPAEESKVDTVTGEMRLID